ncbi:MAG: hypothetical protein ABSG00_00585 [Terracidiphilus sp.]|jgi:hypothetical protein
MAAKITNISDFLKGFFYGIWIGITTSPFKSNVEFEETVQKKRKAAAEKARARSEIGFISTRE